MPGPGALGPGMPRGRARRRHLPDHRRTVGVNDPDSVTAGTAGKQPVPPRPGRACCRGAGRKDRPAPQAPSRRPRPGRRALRSADEGEPACPESWLPGPVQLSARSALEGTVVCRGRTWLTDQVGRSFRRCSLWYGPRGGGHAQFPGRGVSTARWPPGGRRWSRWAVAWSRRRSWVPPVRSSAAVSGLPSRPWPSPRPAKRSEGAGRARGAAAVCWTWTLPAVRAVRPVSGCAPVAV